MVYRPEDRKKLIVLGLASVACVIYAIVFFLMRRGEIGTVAPGATTHRVVTASLPGTAASGSAVPASPTPAPDSDATDQDTRAALTPTRDPFRPPVNEGRANPLAGTTSPSSARPPVLRPSILPMTTRPQVAPVTPPPANGLPPFAIAPATQPAIELKGVILGKPAIAVLSVDGQTFYSKVKDRLPAGMRLTQITETGVLIRTGARTIMLDVGHSIGPVKQSGMSAPAPANPSGINTTSVPTVTGTLP
jgi:hypothetical protein